MSLGITEIIIVLVLVGVPVLVAVLLSRRGKTPPPGQQHWPQDQYPQQGQYPPGQQPPG
ncbi:hypothetical protein [Actinokineospora pegani]|uniref:hypothetical protein n=1 Tax=Actinokineospora pegani TaxID=2654637 RepID=UPI0012E9D330|nr:hypothetical protein [Actinokineospora pegani]